MEIRSGVLRIRGCGKELKWVVREDVHWKLSVLVKEQRLVDLVMKLDDMMRISE